MDRVSKNRPISRAEFEARLSTWLAAAGGGDTIGDTSTRGQTAWVCVRDGGSIYYLNADNTHDAVRPPASQSAVTRRCFVSCDRPSQRLALSTIRRNDRGSKL